MGDADTLKEFCLRLIHADSESDVVQLLQDANCWDDPKLWRSLGDQEFNYSSVGNQQSRAEQAVIEKLINAIDTKLIAAARIDPESPEAPNTVLEARDRFFGEQLKDPETLSRGITVAATGAKPPGRPCFTIVDDGEGQSPTSMPETILSLHKGNKDRIKFVQGKFNMGGTGVLEFCGVERNLQLVVSKRNPALLPDPVEKALDADWSFTVVRRENPSRGKSSRFTYLAPLNANQRPGEGDLLHFAAKALPIFPERNRPYARDAEWGTLIKLYEYDARRFGTSMMLEDGLMYRARLLLPEPALPIRFHECRSYSGHRGSFDTTMVGLIETLKRDIDSPRRDSVEWFDVLEFDVDSEKFTARIYLFKNKKAADSYRSDEGVLFTYNGQCHAIMTKDFFRRKRVKQDYLWHSLLMFIDCSRISIRAHERLFMNSRDRLRDGDLKRKLESELEDLIGGHDELRELASERRKKDLADKADTSESMAKVIEKLLSKSPALAALLGAGTRIKNPNKPDVVGAGIAGFIGKRFPTRFHFKGHEAGVTLVRDAHLNSRVRIIFETDAANDYFKRDDQPGEFSLLETGGGKVRPTANYQRPRLLNGQAYLSLSLPDGAAEGDLLQFEARLTDPSRIEPFRNAITLVIKAEKATTSGSAVNGGRTGTGLGNERGTKEGQGQTKQQTYLDIPEPVPVHEKDWQRHDPNFDRFTAMRVMERPDAQAGENHYDYYLNMDNVHLQTFLKARSKEARSMRLRYSVGMTLVALSLLHQEHLRAKHGVAIDRPNDTVDVRDRVAQVTSALAPFLLPMIESVSELDEEPEHLSDSAGEAA